MTIDTSKWTKIGQSSNADFYEIDPHILAVVPFDGAIDDASTARESVHLQLDHLRKNGRRAGTIVFMDRVIEQASGARSVYRDEPDPAFLVCFALVGGTTFGRAVGSVFIGIHPPRVPTKMFATLEEAVTWIRARLEA